MAYAQPSHDWAKFGTYAQQNAELKAAQMPVSVVFYGNSITQIWYELRPEFFTSNGFVGRGIGGQTSSELLVRFRQDVIDLHPQTAVILCGVNDIAQNNGIRPVLCSPLPARSFYWHPAIIDVPQKISALKDLIQEYAESHGILYVDYYSAMVDSDGGLRPGLSDDEVHPTPAGYEIMEAIILQCLLRRDVSGLYRIDIHERVG